MSESGELKKKYFLFRNVIAKATGITPPDPPAADRADNRCLHFVSLVGFRFGTHFPQPIDSAQILSMEDVGQSYGYILYRTNLAQPQRSELHIDELHSYAQVYLDGVCLRGLSTGA